MDKVKIFLEDGNEKLVNCIFYLYNSKYYFLYTLNELDENGYVRLYLVKVGKETTNTPNGLAETGNMVGIEVPTDEEWKEVQGSISKIVSSKKTKIEDNDIKYLPISMLANLKIVSKKTFRLLSGIIENDFGVNISEELNQDSNGDLLNDTNLNKPIDDSYEQPADSIIPSNEEATDTQLVNNNVDVELPVEIKNQSFETPIEIPIESVEGDNTEISNESIETNVETSEQVDTYEEDNSDIIIDYRTRFFEEQEKNKRLNEEIEKLKEKLKNIDEIIKGE